MAYDKYKNYPLPTDTAAMTLPPMPSGIRLLSFEQQVLADLAGTEDEIDKMEILDSFGAWHERKYRASLVLDMADKLGRFSEALIVPYIDRLLPGVGPIHRGRPVQEK